MNISIYEGRVWIEGQESCLAIPGLFTKEGIEVPNKQPSEPTNPSEMGFNSAAFNDAYLASCKRYSEICRNGLKLMEKIIKCEFITEAKMPPGGPYMGNWSGYVITIPINGGNYQLTTSGGIRGTKNVEVTVDRDGNISFVISS